MNQNHHRPAPAKTLPVKILRGYWPEDGSPKLPAGTEIELPIDEAKKLISECIAIRNDALPS